MAAAAAPKTLEEVAALASIRVDDLKEFKEADFEELTRELGIPVTAKVKLRGLFRKLLASQPALLEGVPPERQRSGGIANSLYIKS